jgi:hypothetical protein
MEETMPAIIAPTLPAQSVKVEEISAERLVISVGPSKFFFLGGLSVLQNMASAPGGDVMHLLKNMAISLGIAKVDVSNPAAIKAAIEGQTYRF